MTHSLLYHFRRKSKPSILRPVDAPRRIEMPKRVHAAVLRFFYARLDFFYPSPQLSRAKPATYNIVQLLDLSGSVRKDVMQFFRPLSIASPPSDTRLGQIDCQSLRVSLTKGGSGTVRSPASDLGRPISLKRSAR